MSLEHGNSSEPLPSTLFPSSLHGWVILMVHESAHMSALHRGLPWLPSIKESLTPPCRPFLNSSLFLLGMIWFLHLDLLHWNLSSLRIKTHLAYELLNPRAQNSARHILGSRYLLNKWVNYLDWPKPTKSHPLGAVPAISIFHKCVDDLHTSWGLRKIALCLPAWSTAHLSLLSST